MRSLRLILSEGFRAFFLLAGLFAIAAVAAWEGWVLAQVLGWEAVFPPGMAPQHWHAHEMVFGYGGAALGGFLLTAVPNWTGGKGAGRGFIAVAAGVWLAGRAAMSASGALPPAVVAAADLAFAPLMFAQVLAQLIRRPKPQQMIFLALLALFWTANLWTHLDWAGVGGDAWTGLRAGLATLAGMIMVLGGRVTPGFTRNAMVQAGRDEGLPQNPRALAALAIVAALSVPLSLLAGVPFGATGALAVVAGVAGLTRVSMWQGVWTRGRPILWSLHLSYAANAMGLLLFGLAALGWGDEVGALHILGIAGVGGMTLAVMSRATLGHAGRALAAPTPVVLAYALIPLAALIRAAGAAFPALHDAATLAAGALWIAAFAAYVTALWPVWSTPRPPRAPVGHPPM